MKRVDNGNSIKARRGRIATGQRVAEIYSREAGWGEIRRLTAPFEMQLPAAPGGTAFLPGTPSAVASRVREGAGW